MGNNKKTKVGMAMSGGVDSTVAAALLKEQGYAVYGFFMLLPVPELEAQQERVSRVAETLQIPLQFVELANHFTDTVIKYFLSAYRQGMTPNPCIYCNQYIKFGIFMRAMMAAGMDKTASGHYAQIIASQGQSLIARSPDPLKDQSYFLCRVKSHQLDDHIFPLAQWSKQKTYQKAKSMGFDFQGQESQDVCFLPGDLHSFLSSRGLKEHPGEIISTNGTSLASHQGIWRYTIGQRRGLGVPDATPWYVTAIDAPNNQIVIGKNEELLHETLTVHSLQWHRKPALFPWQGVVQIRSRHTPVRAKLTLAGHKRGRIVFTKLQRAITPGQYAAFYDGDKLIGSGIIEKYQQQRSTVPSCL